MKNNKATPRFMAGDIVTNDFVHSLILSVDDPVEDVYSIIILERTEWHIHHQVYLGNMWRIV